MTENYERLNQLLELYKTNQITEAETGEMLELVDSREAKALLEQKLARTADEEDELIELSQSKWDAIWEKIIENRMCKRSVHRIHFLKTAWFRYAAAVLLICCIGAYLYFKPSETNQSVVATKPVPVKNEIAPGKNGAILTLADGTSIVLDSLQNGTIATQNGATVVLENGQLAYKKEQPLNREMVWNTMTTPRGRQFQLLLPDGTKVWLNAASSLRYPTLFAGSLRKVEVTGEAYFEVAKNEHMPFVVSINHETEVQVLGTHFNINAYLDEMSIRTTLLEGSIKVSKQQYSALLQPGQSAIIKDKIDINKNVNAQRSIAWKNGVFNFEDAPFDEFMRQLARWYDLEIIYKGEIPNKILRGKLGRNLQLSQILKVLSLFEVKYLLEGKKLTIE